MHPGVIVIDLHNATYLPDSSGTQAEPIYRNHIMDMSDMLTSNNSAEKYDVIYLLVGG